MPARHCHRLPCLGLTALLLCSVSCVDGPRKLESGTVHERSSPELDEHHYRFDSPAGAYVEIEVRQRHVDMEIELIGPFGDTVIAWDSDMGDWGREWLCLRLQEEGGYFLKLTARDPNHRGTYRLSLDIARAPSSVQARREEAFQRLYQGSAVFEEQPEKGRELLQQARALWRGPGEADMEALSLIYEAKAWGLMNRSDRKRRCYEEVVKRLGNTGSVHLRAMSHHNLGTVYHEQGWYDKAVASYLEALRLRPEGDRNRATTLESLGTTHTYMGDLTNAWIFFERARAFRERPGDATGRYRTYLKLGALLTRMGKTGEAKEYFDRAASHVEGEDRAYLLSERAYLSWHTGQYSQAVADYEEALFLAPPRWHTNIRGNYIEALVDAGRIEKAQAVVPLLPESTDPMTQAHFDYLRARVLHAAGHNGDAMAQMKRVQTLVESIARNRLSPEDRVTLRAHRYIYTEFMLDRIVEAGDWEGAFLFAERNRAQLLAHQLRAKTPDLELEGHIRTLSERLAILRTSQGKDPAVDARIADLTRRIDFSRANLQQDSDRPKHQTPLTLAEIRDHLIDPGITLLFYAMGKDSVHRWVIDTESIRPLTIGDRQEIESLARNYQEALADNPIASEDMTWLSDKLSRVLLDGTGPLKPRVLVVPDDALHYVSFGALMRDETERLGDRHEVIHLPSCRAGKLLKTRPRPARRNEHAAILTIENFRNGMPSLPGVVKEVAAIQSRAEPRQVIVYTDEAVTRQNMFLDPVQSARYLHIATHGIYGDRSTLSGLVLHDGFLLPSDIAQLDLSAEVVMTTACSTGLGREIRGEGLAGLAQSFLIAGADGVIVSLWRVDDAATAALTASFYEGLWQFGLSPPAALSYAQKQVASQPAWQAPYYWAGFLYMGFPR
ncbi:MAG: CHAT domain-containing tetratricopeptide repeat protein [Acidobacteriota bacterium]|nr:CHAT domain-containing tetratricopeptide repeat protein [Acidobacteriota bacterium]